MKAELSRRAVLCGIPLALAGCLSTPSVVPTRYYTLHIEAPLEAGLSTGKSLGIRPLTSARPYKLEIAYKAESHRLAYFSRAEWADTPATAVNRALTDAIRSLEVFSDVGDAADMVRPDYILTGELRRFEADYTTESPHAVVELSLAIRDSMGQGAFWEGLLSAHTPLPPGLPDGSPSNVDAIAAAMSAAVSTLIVDCCIQIRQAATPAA